MGIGMGINEGLVWVVLITAGGSIIAIITFWMNRGRTEGETSVVASEAKRSSAEAHEKIAALDAAFGIYRERVAADYVSRSVLREVEERITGAIDRIADRLDRIIEHATKTGK